MSKEENLLPLKNPKDTRKTLVLDLDETLVHSFLDHNEKTTYLCSCVRPHLEEFLKECAKMFELVLFTASKDNYANKVLD